jgi:hypothetical protein
MNMNSLSLPLTRFGGGYGDDHMMGGYSMGYGRGGYGMGYGMGHGMGGYGMGMEWAMAPEHAGTKLLNGGRRRPYPR